MRRTFVSIGALGIVGAIAVTVTVLSATGTSKLTTGNVSILNRPATAADQLPERVRSLPSSTQFTDANDARLAQTTADAQVFVVPGDDGALCLVVVWTDASGTNCSASQALDNGAIYLARPGEAGTMEVWGIVADDVEDVGGMAVKNNTFAFRGPTSASLSMRAGSEVRHLEIGSLQPPTP